MANPNTPVLQALLQQIGPVAQQLGISTLLIVAKDPQTGELAMFGSTESMGTLRDFTERKFDDKLGIVGETAWE